MAETNLGQVVGIWLEPTEPPHKNVLWIKTINLLTSEKTGFIWNGIEWINIQGLGFSWKGEFDQNADYTQNDVVKFDDMLYIKRNDIVNNGDAPDVSVDFDLFLPAATPIGIEGSVQVKDANGKLFGSSLLSFIAGLFSVYGSLFIKSNSSSSGNALEVRNATNQNLKTITNKGEESKVVTITGNPVENIAIDTTLNYTLSAFTSTFGRSLTGDNLALNVNIATAFNPTFLVGRKTVLTQTGANIGVGIYHHVASWNEVKGGNGLAGYFNNAILVGDAPVYHAQPTSDPKGYFMASAYGASAGMTMDLYAFDGGMKTVATFSRGGSGNPLGNMLDVGDGVQLAFYLFIDRTLNSPNIGANDTVTSDYLGVRVKDTTQFSATTEMFFKTTQAGVSVEPLVLTGKDVKMGFANGKQGFYGKQPISKQTLPQNATPQQILEALENLGLLDIIIP